MPLEQVARDVEAAMPHQPPDPLDRCGCPAVAFDRSPCIASDDHGDGEVEALRRRLERSLTTV
jgi:hypothetical protein